MEDNKLDMDEKDETQADGYYGDEDKMDDEDEEELDLTFLDEEKDGKPAAK